VFHDASVNPIIFILTKNTPNDQCRVAVIEKYDDIDKMYSDNQFQLCKIENWEKSNDKQFQILQTEDFQHLLEKIHKNTDKGEKLLDVSQGIVPYSSEHLSSDEIKSRIYHSNEEIDKTYGIWVQGRAINRYSINLETHEYLKYGTWLHRPRKQKYFQNQRILIQEITGGNPPRLSATLIDRTLYHDPGIISCLNISGVNIKYILAVLNSRLISWYHNINSPKGNRTTFPKVLIGDIRNFPIKKADIDIQNSLAAKVDLILKPFEELLKEKVSFLKSLKEEKVVYSETKILSNFWDLPYEEFKKELKKQKIEFKLGDENNQWRDYFNNTSEKIKAIQSDILKTDMEIDKLIYNLYELTDEEIKIIEEQ
jgi:hypothetical protein